MRVSLYRRVVAVNAVVLVGAALLLALSPATVSAEVTPTEWAVLAIGTALVIGVNVLLLRRVFGPLERLESVMQQIDPHAPGARLDVDGPVQEIARLSKAFNGMLDRLERERAQSGRRALLAQESERSRVARELHDEVGQLLTSVVLQLDGLVRAVPPERREDALQVQATAREGVETVREIARGLRPAALDEFGLRSALVALATGFADRTGLNVRHHLDAQLPGLGVEAELAIYRVAQEAMTNAARHSGGTRIVLELRQAAGEVVLSVRDDGSGVDESDVAAGAGIAGMRERALLVGGRLSIERRPFGGTDVRLEVPFD
jgi:two-component system sensor histidine kinase UhpB